MCNCGKKRITQTPVTPTAFSANTSFSVGAPNASQQWVAVVYVNPEHVTPSKLYANADGTGQYLGQHKHGDVFKAPIGAVDGKRLMYPNEYAQTLAYGAPITEFSVIEAPAKSKRKKKEIEVSEVETSEVAE